MAAKETFLDSFPSIAGIEHLYPMLFDFVPYGTACWLYEGYFRTRRAGGGHLEELLHACFRAFPWVSPNAVPIYGIHSLITVQYWPMAFRKALYGEIVALPRGPHGVPGRFTGRLQAPKFPPMQITGESGK